MQCLWGHGTHIGKFVGNRHGEYLTSLDTHKQLNYNLHGQSSLAYLVHVPPLYVGITKTELDHSLQHNTAVDMTAMPAACTSVAVVKHTLSYLLIWIKV